MATVTEQQAGPGLFGRVSGAILGRRLATGQEQQERLSKVGGLAILAADNLSSVAYATDELLLVLVLAGAAGLAWSVPLSLSIIGLIAILVFSYRQTVKVYPQGGGAYNVAKHNLGTQAGLAAASGLLIDYVLTVAVSSAAGSAAIVAAFPGLKLYMVHIAVGAVGLLVLVNLRGVRSTGRLFTLPTLFFAGSMLLLLGGGVYRVISGDIPPSVEAQPALTPAVTGLTAFLLLRAFSSGLAAATGVEAVSNAVYLFRAPESANARTVLLWMGAVLGTLFLGVTWLAREFNIVPVADETVVSQVATAVFGIGPLYYLVQFSTLLILLLAANTAFAGFPRVASVLAKDGYLPRQLSTAGHRLVYSNGIILLAAFSAVLLVAFQARVHNLIPIYAVGVFLSFTLSQSGMVRHWLRERGSNWRTGALINGVGAVVTACALVIIAVTKFTHGGWTVILLVLLFVYLFRVIRRHYDLVARELSLDEYAPPAVPFQHTVVVPISGVHRAVLDALTYARALSSNIRAVYICTDYSQEAAIRAKWKKHVPDLPLDVVYSPYRLVIRPFLKFVDEVRGVDAHFITVVIADFVPRHWWEWSLHSQTGWLFRLALMLKKNVAVVSVHHQLPK